MCFVLDAAANKDGRAPAASTIRVVSGNEVVSSNSQVGSVGKMRFRYEENVCLMGPAIQLDLWPTFYQAVSIPYGYI